MEDRRVFILWVYLHCSFRFTYPPAEVTIEKCDTVNSGIIKTLGFGIFLNVKEIIKCNS